MSSYFSHRRQFIMHMDVVWVILKLLSTKLLRQKQSFEIKMDGTITYILQLLMSVPYVSHRSIIIMIMNAITFYIHIFRSCQLNNNGLLFDHHRLHVCGIYNQTGQMIQYVPYTYISYLRNWRLIRNGIRTCHRPLVLPSPIKNLVGPG